MGWLADWLSRKIWYSVLWLMRRDFIRHVQKLSFKGKRYEALVKQNLWAYKHGRKFLRVVIYLFLMYLLVGFVYLASQWLLDSGYFRPPGSNNS